MRSVGTQHAAPYTAMQGEGQVSPIRRIRWEVEGDKHAVRSANWECRHKVAAAPPVLEEPHLTCMPDEAWPRPSCKRQRRGNARASRPFKSEPRYVPPGLEEPHLTCMPDEASPRPSCKRQGRGNARASRPFKSEPR